MARAKHFEHEAEENLRGQVQILQRAVGALNERLSTLNPEGDVMATRRKILELDWRLAQLERADLVLPSKPFSD